MSAYRAPLEDIQFVLTELAELEAITSHCNEEMGPELIEAILTEAGRFAGGVLAPLNAEGDTHGASIVDGKVVPAPGFAEAYEQFVEGGWSGVSLPKSHGGMGLPDLLGSAVAELWAAANTSFALCPMLTQGAINSVLSHGSDALKNAYLDKMVSGEWTGTMNLTEPQAGSDLAAIRTRAVAEGGRYRLFGTKIFITWGDHEMTDNIVHLVLARTPDAPAGVKGISLFLVPKYLLDEAGEPAARNDVFPVSVEKKLGIHASPTCVMSFGGNQAVEGEHGAIGYLVGEENQGLAYMFTMMNHARLNVGMQGVALSDRAYQHAVNYAKERVQGRAAGDVETGAIIRHPDVRRMLMTMRSLTEASRAVNYVAVAQQDLSRLTGDDVSKSAAQARLELMTPIAKGWATEVAQEVTSLGVQIHGGMGFIEETGAAQYMRDARITSIYEGTTGIQANDLIGRKLIRDGGAAMTVLIEEMRATERDLSEAGEAFADMRHALKAALELLDDCCQWVLAGHTNDPRLAASAAFDLLMLAGTVVGGWLMARSALICRVSGGSTGQFQQTKYHTATFYCRYILPRSKAYASSLKAGSDALMALDEEAF